MKKNFQVKKQALLDKLSELADCLSAGRRVNPNMNGIKLQLEAIQAEIENLKVEKPVKRGE